VVDDEVTSQDGSSGGADPRAMLGRFANENDEWVRLIVRHVLDTGEALDAGQIDEVYRATSGRKRRSTHALSRPYRR
jgi:hypothetical protein